ncbi:helix-turn-helix transcriptional regulator [Devosia sp. WQ 349]|uniref:helix-turn-helix domain-containing protein n=1 Tax=Devosia sp. WQ 349K1 TaxID=2800329 RepID=UPI0019076CE9|nr:XRE family transcriptional regulator [Devosia sp. WQ 349K1]MBK1794427.1 helix-turn-helix transcriptional regulator [Devosia sp. WQ 349K1]
MSDENTENDVPPSTDSADVRVGSRLRAFRKSKGLTIDDVAQRAGVTKSFISRFERDEVQASVATLLRVCDVIGVKPGEIFEPPATSYVPKGAGVPISLGGEKMREYLVSGASNEHLMALYSVIEPGGGSGHEPYALKAAADLVHVQTGQLRIVIGSEEYLLLPGDTLTFPPTIPHTWENPSKTETCTALWVIVPPPA